MASKYAVSEEKEKPEEKPAEKSDAGDGGSEDDEDETMIFKYTKKNEDGSSEIIEEEWSIEHAKILYLMSKYAKSSAVGGRPGGLDPANSFASFAVRRY